MKVFVFLFATVISVSSAFAKEVSFEGTLAKVVPAKKEIYVQTASGKIELYFKPETRLTRAGKPAEFSELKENAKVKVTADKVGKRQTPISVEIID